MSYDENPADNDLHGECRNEIHQLQNLLGQVYDQCGNHRAADRRHCLSPGLRDEIQGYLQAAGHQRAIAEQENKGDDMAETHDSELRKRFFLLRVMTTVESDEEDPVRWGQVRMNYLEQHLQKLLDDIRRLERENEQLKLELENEKSAYKRLEQENEQLELENLQNLKVAKTDEEIHERRRRERMLDEITLICVRDRIEQLIDAGAEHFEPGATTETRWGRNSRDTADNICRGINEYDAE